MTREFEMKNTLVVIQCCASKKGTEKFPTKEIDLSTRLSRTHHILEKGQLKFEEADVIKTRTPRVSALSLYTGWFYRTTPVRQTINQQIETGYADFLIMSAGYGFVHPFQKIHKYDQQMKGTTTRFWLTIGLPKVLAEYIEWGKFQNVYGFFSKTGDYRKIFEAADWQEMSQIQEAGYFYLDRIQGTSTVLQKLAGLFVHELKNNFMQKPTLWDNAKVIYCRSRPK